MGDNTRQRRGNIEALRILAMLLIIMGHMLGDTGGNLLGQAELYSWNWYLLWALESICVLGTNCFILISGYFIIDSKFSWTKCLKFGCQIWFYSILLYLLSLIGGLKSFELSGLMKALTPVLGRTWWYASTYMAVFIVSPYVKRLILNLNKDEHRRLIIVLVALFSLLPTIYPFVDSFVSGGGSGIIWFITLYFIASYIRRYPEDQIIRKKGTIRVTFVILILVISASKYIITFFTSQFIGKPIGTSIFYTTHSIINLSASVMLFKLFLQAKIDNEGTMYRFIRWGGSVAFGVYLLHNNPFTSERMWSIINNHLSTKPPILLLQIFVIGSIIFIICGMMDWIRQFLFESISKAIKNNRNAEQI